MQRMALGWPAVIVTFLICLPLKSACSRQSKVIVVSMDGFRYDYLDMAKTQGRNISAFEALYNRGFRGRLVPVMPTITFPTHFATATGRHVENHGIVNNVFHDPQQNTTFSYRNLTNAREPKWWNYNGDEPIWMTNERLGYKSCTFFWPGSASSYNGKLPTKTKLVYNSSIPFTSRVDEIIQWMREDDEITLCMLYMREPDYSGHIYGPDSKEVMDRVEELNGVVDHLVKLINATPNLRNSVNVILTSDHGMAYVPQENSVPLYEILNSGNYIVNPSRIFVGIWPKPGKFCHLSHHYVHSGGPTVQEMYTKLIQANLTGATVYLKENLPAYYHYANSTRTPPLIVVADTGYAIFTEPPQYYSKGEHGYDNRDKRMHASLVVAGPNLRHVDSTQEIQQIDIYPLVCGLLNLTEPNKSDGDIRRVADFINPKPNNEFIWKYMSHAAGGPVNTPPDASVKNSVSVLSILVLLMCLL